MEINDQRLKEDNEVSLFQQTLYCPETGLQEKKTNISMD